MKTIQNLETLAPFEMVGPETSPARLSSPARIASILARIEQEDAKPANAMEIEFNGGAMTPTFQPGEVATLRPTSFPRLGSVVVAEVYADGYGEGAVCAMRLFLGDKPGTFVFTPDNPDFNTHTFHAGQVRILGEVVKKGGIQ